MTGSMAVLTSAIDSMLDILMSGVNFLAIRQAEQPADENHAYGHGKFETMATLIQSLVIGGSGVWIILESIRRLTDDAVPQRLGSGIIVLIISTLVSWGISKYLVKVARETESTALKADSLHFSMDVYTNMALVLGLTLVSFFNITWLDPIMSILVACYILLEAFRLISHGIRDVLDEQLPGPVREQIETIIKNHGWARFSYHDLRTRRAGSQKIIDFHMTVCKHLSVEEAHQITDDLEEEIGQEIQGTDITIHIEPCGREHCPGRETCENEIIRFPVIPE